MDIQITPTRSEKLDEAIDRVLQEMEGLDTTSTEYAKLVTQLQGLYKAMEIDANIKVKIYDAVAKSNDLEQKRATEEYDLQNKRELADQANKLKGAELGMQQMKFEAEAELRDVEIEAKKTALNERRRVSTDTLVLAAANLAGIVAVLNYERTAVVVSKAFGWIRKL